MVARITSRAYVQAKRIMAMEEPDLGRVRSLLTDAHAGGDVRAAYALASWHIHGVAGLPKSIQKAIPLLQEAAEARLPDALAELALCYEEGAGVKRNLRKAFLYYLDAALLGNKSSIFEVGRCYYYGIGVSRNVGIAERWLTRARELNVYEELKPNER